MVNVVAPGGERLSLASVGTGFGLRSLRYLLTSKDSIAESAGFKAIFGTVAGQYAAFG